MKSVLFSRADDTQVALDTTETVIFKSKCFILISMSSVVQDTDEMCGLY